MEKVAASAPDLPATILRFPKLYGVEDNRNLGSVYGARTHPARRRTHGYVGNVAQAVVPAAAHPGAAGRIYNAGGQERRLWPSGSPRCLAARRIRVRCPAAARAAVQLQPGLVLDTGRIRTELGYEERWDERDMMLRIAAYDGSEAETLSH